MEDEEEGQGVSILAFDLVLLIEFMVRLKGGIEDEEVRLTSIQ